MDEQANAPRITLLQAGFTLIEVLIVMVIVGILLTVALPSMSDMITNQKVRGVANELFFDLSYARSEAIKRNVVVRVDRTGADWTGGWTVVETGGPTVLRTQPPTKGVTAAGAGNASVSFNADGRTTLGGSLSFEFTSSSSVVSKRCVLLTPSGRPAVRIDRDRNGVCADG